MAHESNPAQAPALAALRTELLALRADLHSAPGAAAATLRAIAPARRGSAVNLLHYLALRRRDLRPLQLRLAAQGLSSLGRAEPHVLATVDAVLAWLGPADAAAPQPGDLPWQAPGYARGERLLARRVQALLGPARAGREVRIMVTMPGEAATDPSLVRDLLARGMDCMRINCAHDDEAAWAAMIGHLRSAEQELGRGCRLLMDLGGPKLRTGPVAAGPAVLHLRPGRDALGRVTAPGRVLLCAQEAAPVDGALPVPGAWLDRLQPGDSVRFTDARGARRRLRVIAREVAGCRAEIDQSAYLVPGTQLRREGARGKADTACVGALPRRPGAILLHTGDLLWVEARQAPGTAAAAPDAPARIACTLPEVFADVRAGESVWFDDGRIGGRVEAVTPGRLVVRVTQARPQGERLLADKGINLPETALQLPALTARDLEVLPFVAHHADLVGLSFANGPGDVHALQAALSTGRRRPAIVLKIETRRGFTQLPGMLLAALAAPRCGVMIARGDLAVECGFERLAEVQEEILWICEAAHVPVIWATQVLETLAREGRPSRAEITDAAMSNRAECVMLNKGPHVLGAVAVLDDILRRMQPHQAKKRALLRELHLAHALAGAGGVPGQ